MMISSHWAKQPDQTDGGSREKLLVSEYSENLVNGNEELENITLYKIQLKQTLHLF